MSEYQYYEFQTTDRRLSEREMHELRSYSTRAHITPTSFVNEYSFGNFKGNQDAWMEKYFDAFLYLANWGTHILQFRVPDRLLSLETAKSYCAGHVASARQKSGHLIFKFVSEEEPTGEWVQGEDRLAALLPVRAELIRGDLRTLYLGWLLCAQEGELDDDVREPVVPPNLGHLSPALSAFAEFVRLGPDLIAVAATASLRTKSGAATSEEGRAWLASLPPKARDDLLVRVMEGEEAQVGGELCAQFTRQRVAANPIPDGPRRTVGELMAAARSHAEQRRRKETRQAAEEQARRERAAAAARAEYLAALSGKAPDLWRQVEELVSTRQPKNYDLAVQHLVDLRDLAARRGGEADFGRRFAALRETHAGKRTFGARLLKVGL